MVTAEQPEPGQWTVEEARAAVLVWAEQLRQLERDRKLREAAVELATDQTGGGAPR
jgi:hypothetical protein